MGPKLLLALVLWVIGLHLPSYSFSSGTGSQSIKH